MNRLQSLAIDVRIVLGRLDGGVAEQFLDGAEIGSAGEQMSGEAVA